jgi:carbonic anhydrase/acetyltransferase-like protein (isoleucine patch superfamily)
MIIEFDEIKPVIAPNVFIAPNAAIIGDVTIGEGTSIWFGVVLRGDMGKIVIGSRCHIQDNVVIHGETLVEDEVTVTHGAILHVCKVCRGAFIGMNATVLDHAVIGENALIAAGSVVPEKAIIPPWRLAAGCPAAVKKELSGRSLEWVSIAQKTYNELTEKYIKQKIGLMNFSSGPS